MRTLHPTIVWSHFATLCETPRPSYKEAALKAKLSAWAAEHGIAAREDAVGNLILSKASSPGCEQQPGVILQGHLDMVCQANSGTVHDFERDAISTVVRDGWLIAANTTLGADNGIGVALALAALEAPGLVHPPLEVLLTINEESGMDGARGLTAGELQGKTLINLDTEEWGHFYLGCAGGVDVEVRMSCASVRGELVEPCTDADMPPSTSSGRTEDLFERIPEDYALLRFDVSGLRGGHSGIDIHQGRGNAIKLLAEALRDLSAHSDVRLIELSGGTARNAIPREAYALCALPIAVAASIDEWVKHRHESWQTRYAAVDAKVTFAADHLPHIRGKDGMGVAQLSTEDSTPSLALPEETTSHSTKSASGQVAGYLLGGGYALTIEASDRILAFLDTSLNGVNSMSADFDGVTDTSSNLGVVGLHEGKFKATFKVRSLHDARATTLADKLVSYAKTYELQAWTDGAYPGWTPNPASPLLALCQQVYNTRYGQPAGLQVIHAGLECGLLAASHPHLDMISFGPDISGAHAPGERVEIASVARCWELLQDILQALARK
ncbi:MAG: M20/M25/M40 family metallo-hydrolase [Gallionella sp.]|nr:M20/M25/M40 family metallo-hydrolase [Gallionella sp.]